MFFSLLAGVIIVITACFSPASAWGLIFGLDAWLVITLWSLKRTQYPACPLAGSGMIQIDELWARHAHYYMRPVVCRMYSRSASTLTLLAGVVVLIGLFRGFWWGLAWGVVAYVLSAMLAPEFDPSRFVREAEDRLAHQMLDGAVFEA